ncbi:hypothetical protein DSO57_1027587 [Entomophthora muscae]|uniref:Uncharacterized protein n=1 Tax=Entomophthora muscae TaxID=34485 RepID=A0ACC2TDY3_9FUNG|nr:hypothetical protein DSO57_1027587 [Entomophthora muscae]
MLLPLLRFTVFTLAPVLVMTWSTSPDLWGNITSSTHHAGDNPFKLFRLLKDLPNWAQDLIVAGENLVKSLTCDDINLFLLIWIQRHSPKRFSGPRVFTMDTHLSGPVSLGLDGIMVVHSTRLGAKLS